MYFEVWYILTADSLYLVQNISEVGVYVQTRNRLDSIRTPVETLFLFDYASQIGMGVSVSVSSRIALMLVPRCVEKREV